VLSGHARSHSGVAGFGPDGLDLRFGGRGMEIDDPPLRGGCDRSAVPAFHHRWPPPG